jgi:hypothetical protein
VVRVRALGVPVRVLAAAREHHDNVMREFRLLACPAARRRVRAGSARRADAGARRAVRRLAGAAGRRRRRRPRPGEDTVELTYDVPVQVAAQAQVLDALMAEADEYCSTEELLTVQRSRTIAEFGAWYLQQFVTPVRGRCGDALAGSAGPGLTRLGALLAGAR